MKKNHEGKTPKMSKNDRFAQMTQQERLIEEKKREIQNKLEARRRQNIEDSKRERAQASQPKLLEESSSSSSSSGRPNAFSNDGSFLEQFKQLKEKKMDNKSRALNKYNDRNRWNKLPGQSSSVVKPVRFSLEKQQITITTKTTFPSQSQSNPEEPKIEVPNPPLTSENNQQPSTVTQQLSLQQSSASIYQNTDQNVDQQQVIFTPPRVQQIQPEFTVNPPQNQPQFSISQPQTEASPQIIQQFNTLPPQINQLQPSIQVLNTQNQEITVQQHLVAPQTQIYQPIQVQQGGVQQVHLQAIQGTEGSLSLIQQPIGNQQVLLNVPPPQLVQTQLTNIVLTSQAQNVLVSAPTTVQLTTLTLPPPVLTGQTVELASIPPPNPIQVQNIPQPEPLNTMNIPPPAPLQVQNIPTPTTLHMNQIPDPKPLDLLNIPTPNNGHEFLKNIPPPNKSVPPPHAGVQFMSGAPQEVLIHTLPPSNQIQSSNLQIQDAQQGILAPQGQIQVPSSLHSQIQLPSSLQGTIQLAQNQQPQSSNLIQGQISVSNLMQGPPNSLQGLIQTPNSNQLVLPNQIQDPSSLQSQIQASISLQRPPSMLPNESSPLPPTPQPQNQPPNFQNRPGSAPIPSLMSMPVMPPPGMEMNMPPPPISRHSAPPPGFDQMGRGMAPMSVPPPMGGMGQDREMDYGPDTFNVFPPGSKIFEAMSSLARMVVDCGPSIEDVVKEKKNRDPDLWFLFQKDSAAYSQYQDLIEQYKREKDDSMRHNERDRSFDRERSYEREDRYGRERRGDRYDRDRREDRYDREQREDRYEREQRGARYEREQRDDRYKREQREDRYERELQEDRYEREQMEERYESEQDNDWQDDNRDRRNSVPELKVEKNDEPYEPEMALEDDDDEDSFGIKQEIKQENNEESVEARNERKRKRKSRWGEKDPNVQPPAVVPVVIPTLSHMPPLPLCQPLPMLSKVTRMDPGLMQYVVTNYGSTNLEEDTWKKAEENYKIHLLYQDMMKKRAEVERLAAQGKNKYEYDSDEDTDGGTWEHKLRIKEMTATEKWATELNKQAEGKHHIGDFLPPEELKRFMENCNALKEGRQPNFSDYKEFKIKEDNVGFKMLQKLGWSEGQGLGQNNTGIVEPVNKGAPRADTQGLGLHSELSTEGEDEYETYRKRMMLAYRFRPNPLNNPRRPYY